MDNLPPLIPNMTSLENPNSSANRLVRSLSSLPTETLYQVLDDLSIYHTLKICLHAIHSKANNVNAEHVIHGVTTHLNFRQVLPTRADLMNCLSVFAIYESIRLVRADKVPTNKHFTKFWVLRTPPSLENRLKRDTIQYLSWIWKARLVLLQPFTSENLLSSELDYSNLPAIRARWEALQAAQKRVNAKKCEQLLRAAKIVEAYPDLVRRWNDSKSRAGHVLKQLHDAVTNVQQDHVIRTRPHALHFFKPGQLPIVPMDWCLKLFQDRVQFPLHGTKLEKPVSKGVIESEVSIDGISGSLGKFRISGASGDTFPTELIRDMHTAIKGLAYVYYSPPKSQQAGEKKEDNNVPSEKDPELRRTVDSVYSAPPNNSDSGEPRFRTIYMSGYELPHDDREFEWLEAFLKCVEYLQGNE